MNKREIQEILSDWRIWDKGPVDGIRRDITLPQRLVSDLALIISGVRRCGKSTLMAQMPELYGLDIEQCVFCNFEDPRFLDHLDHTLLSQIVDFVRTDCDDEAPCYFFFDEIQVVKHWEKWLHVQLEQKKNNYFVLTGSNSSLLSGEFASSLTGRHISLELYPFSLSEFSQWTGMKELEDYCRLGGFPRPLHFEHPRQLLQEYFNDIVHRDIVARTKARSVDAVKQVCKMAFDSCGSELSYRKIAATTGVSVETVKLYLEACEQAYLLFACPYFSFSERKRQGRQKKYYPIDPGLKHAITSTTTRDLGKSLELLVYLQLRKTNEQVFYWQEANQGEVDFVALNGQSITPYQVTLGEEQDRHQKALHSFYQAYPHAEDPVFINSANAVKFLGA